MKKNILAAILLGFVFVIVGLLFDFSFAGIIVVGLFGLVSGFILTTKTRKKVKYILAGSWIGFLIPWIIFAYISITYTGPHRGELGFLSYGAMLFSIVLAFIGGLVMYIIFLVKK